MGQSMRGGFRRCGKLFMMDFRASFPIPSVQSGDKALERSQSGGLADSSNIVLETSWKTFIIEADECHIVPTSAKCVVVEIDGVAGGFGGIFIL